MKNNFFLLFLLASIFTNAHIYKCNSTDDIISALNKVKPGDEILIASGTYISSSIKNGAYFYSEANGSAKKPITIKGKTSNVKLKGYDINKGTILRITGNHWIIDGLDFSIGQKGLVLDNANNNVITNCNVYEIGNEAIHVRDGSDNTVIDNCKIYNTGNVNPGFGEGIYVGTDRASWKKYNPNCDNTLIKNCKIGPNVRAEAIDVKEGTQETIIENNSFNALGISGVNSAKSFISLKGTRTYVRNNTFETNGEHVISNGVTLVFRDTPLSGYENAIHDNIFLMDDALSNLVSAYSGTSETYAWNNTRKPSGKYYSKKVIDTIPEWYGSKEKEYIVYEDNLDNNKSRFLGSALSNISVSTPNRGELKLEMKSGATLPPYSPIMYRFPSSIDFSNNPKIVVRVKASEGFKLRFDLHDGTKATNGKNGRVSREIPAGLDKWTDLEFTYPEIAFLDNGVKKSAIKRINIQLDSGKENFPGSLIIDFVKVIETSSVNKEFSNKPRQKKRSKTQKASVNKESTTIKYNDDLNNSKSRFLGSALSNINVSTPNKGELKLEMKSGATLPPYSPIMYRFPSSIDFSNNPKIVVRVKASEGFKLRFDLHDGTKATNGKNGRVSREIPAGLDKWTDLEFTYPEIAYLDNSVKKSSIKRINIQLDSGKENFPGELIIDFIKVVETKVKSKTVTVNKLATDNNTVFEEGSKVYEKQTFNKRKKYVILKMDDLRANKNSSYNGSWQKLVNVIRNHDIKAGLGIIAVDLTKGTQQYKDSLKSWHSSKYFEIWNHGWDHKRQNQPPEFNNKGEFSGTTYEFQKEHFEKSMQYAKKELGIIMRSFGAPYNKTDNTFFRVIEENKNIKVWMYSNQDSYSGINLRRGAKNLLESSTGVVSYDSFLTAYENSETPYIVLQGHPGKWNENSFVEFDRVIKFLKKRDIIFILPYEYYQMTKN